MRYFIDAKIKVFLGMRESKSLIKNLSLVFIVLASLFAFSPEYAQVPRKETTIEVVIELQQEKQVVVAPVSPSVPKRIAPGSKTLPGVRSIQQHLIACLQHHSSLSC
jgi:hypothetical protein